jgi:hypothetical protein
MAKLDLDLTLSIGILVCPFAGAEYAYKAGLGRLVLSFELIILGSGDFSASLFQIPLFKVKRLCFSDE